MHNQPSLNYNYFQNYHVWHTALPCDAQPLRGVDCGYKMETEYYFFPSVCVVVMQQPGCEHILPIHDVENNKIMKMFNSMKSP